MLVCGLSPLPPALRVFVTGGRPVTIIVTIIDNVRYSSPEVVQLEVLSESMGRKGRANIF